MTAVHWTTRSSRTPHVLYLFIALVFILTAACSSVEQSLEQRASALDKKFMCPVCPGETIDQAQVQIAKDMRQIIREKLAAGEDENDVSQFFVDRYGIQVLASPPTSGFNSLVWIVPPVVLGISLTALYMILRDMRRGKLARVGRMNDTTNQALAPYLDAVDEEMKQSELKRRSAGGRASAPLTRSDDGSEEVNG
ncbi:MAG: cytochrome c-type biogenesis protein CcmH [Chloroflexi bacterium]|nr:cytochrome c-type biogenesis protein CcmH [Chloroflexota bacterium]